MDRGEQATVRKAMVWGGRMKTTRRIVVMTNAHPTGVTENFARQIAVGFAACGFEPHIVNINQDLDRQFAGIGTLLSIDELFIVGALPLKVKLGDVYLWEAAADMGKRVTYYVIDSFHNDLNRVPEVKAYIKKSREKGALNIVFADEVTPIYMDIKAPGMGFGAFAAPPIQEEPMFPDRLLVFGGVGNELATIKDTLKETVAEVRQTIDLKDDVELFYPEKSFSESHWNVLSYVMNINDEYQRLLEEPLLLDAYCKLDAAMKRHRRLRVMSALKGKPVDIAGTGWFEHFGEVDNWRYVGQQPHAALGVMVQHYAGLVNFDANWDSSPHDRMCTALMMNRPVMSNLNEESVNPSVANYEHGQGDESFEKQIHQCVERVMDLRENISYKIYSVRVDHLTWTARVSDFLSERDRCE